MTVMYEKTIMKQVFLLLAAITLAGCAINPSFEKSRADMISTLQQSAVCCHLLSELPYRKIANLPYETSRMSASDFEVITNTSPVFQFDGQKSYVMALEIPEVNSKRVLEFWSIPTVSHIKKGGFFSPIVKTLDEQFNEIGRYDGFKFDATDSIGLQKSGIHGQIPLNSGIRYVIFYTNEDELKGNTYYLRPYERDIPISTPEDLNDPSLVVQPHLPEGAFLLKISKT